MLSYLHKFHAGNFADLHKQFILTEILGYLQDKNKPFSMIDTHGGEGYYPFSSKLAKNYRELQSGLGPFFNQINVLAQHAECPKLIQAYGDLLKSWNPNAVLETLPGSPLLLSHFLRKDSHLAICEKHPSVFFALTNNFSALKLKLNSKIALLNSDGYQTPKALLPPKEKRGLIFIDPSYEEKSEYEKIAKCLTESIKRFSTGIYVIWYPILNMRARDGLEWLIRQILKLPIQSLWQQEWLLEPELKPETSGFHSLKGSGLLCIHLPWQASGHLNLTLDYLNAHLFPGRILKQTWLKQSD